MYSKNPVINLFIYMWKYSKGNQKRVVLFLSLEVIACTILLGDAVVIGRVFSNVQFSASDPKLLTYLALNLSLLLVISLSFWALHGTSRVMERKNAFMVRRAYKREMIDKVLHLPLEWHQKRHSGETIDKINKSADAIHDFSESTFIITGASVKIIGSLIGIFIFDWSASLLAIGITIVAVVLMVRFDKILRKSYSAIHKFENHLASAIHDYISNIFSIITLRLSNRVNHEVDVRSLSAYPELKKSVVLNETKWFAISFLSVLMITIALISNAYASFHLRGYIVIGTLFVLYRYLQNIGSVFSDFAYRYGQIVQRDTAVRSAMVINEAYDAVEHTENFSLPSDWKMLEIKDLAFTYIAEDAEKPEAHHLKNITISIERNQKIAFIGESGSGKSTTLALLRGLYPPEHAEVWCDGQKLDAGLAALYDHVTLIPQEPELFNSTVEDNITMDTEVSPEEVGRVIDLAQFKSVLDRLPSGLETYVLEKGVSLSGGEKQRLALARGLLAGVQSDFVFMDEPTSSVDFENEVKIYENVLSTFKDKTVISTVHNLSLLKYFDVIYLFKNGEVAKSGTLDELITDKGFKKIWDTYNKSR